MREKKITIHGGFNDVEIKQYGLLQDKKTFFEKAEFLGKLIANNGHTLVVSWANDYLQSQLMVNTTNNIMKYNFENSAEYHALKGYINNDGPKLKVYVSPNLVKIFNLYTKIKLKYVGRPNVLIELKSNLLKGETIVLDDKIIEKEINSLRQDSIDGLQEYVEKTYLSILLGLPNESLINSLVGKEKKTSVTLEEIVPDDHLWSMIVKDYSVKNANIVIILGGGKATGVAASEAMMEQKLLLPFPEFGGEALKNLYRIKYPDEYALHYQGAHKTSGNYRESDEYVQNRKYFESHSETFSYMGKETKIEDSNNFSLLFKKLTTRVNKSDNKHTAGFGGNPLGIIYQRK